MGGRRRLATDVLGELKLAVMFGAQMVRDVIRLELEAAGKQRQSRGAAHAVEGAELGRTT